jgi:hypothetical protein|tara:strand:+ start:2468 stop:3859 length:1392 start_codon:yes stop_codon:yes gene_type:complete
MFLNRRQILNRMAVGFGGLAFNAMASENQLPRPPHFRPRAKRVIFLFMHGGPSHIDLFDYKPRLEKDNGKPLPFEERKVQFAARGNIMAPPWKLRQVGQSGLWMSELWQHLPKVADEICMLHSVCETNVSHGGACMKIHTGDEALVRPSLGAWTSYGLGTENQNLPGFVTICPTSLHGGDQNFGPAFLPNIHGGVPLGTPGYPNTPAKQAKFHYMKNPHVGIEEQKLQLELLRKLHSQNSSPELEARMQSFELAFRMQMAAPEATDLSGESKTTEKLYGLDDPKTENFGRECLLARRLAERGVRFIQVSHANSLPFNNEQWDQHSHLEKGHSINVGQIDKPITGLLLDLKARGMLDDTLVLWGGEFGRTPTVQSGNKADPGRDHHPDGFTMWMAGGGVKGGFRYGKTDEFGYHAIEDRMTIHDLHATILHLIGLDHTELTHSHNGRKFRLTDVAGKVAHKIIA